MASYVSESGFRARPEQLFESFGDFSVGIKDDEFPERVFAYGTNCIQAGARPMLWMA